MKILITLAKTDLLGGTVIWALTVAKELISRGNDVYILTKTKGRSHRLFKEIGVKEHKQQYYDLILGNHLTLFWGIKGDRIINICHGTIPPLEQPVKWADSYVSISQEVYYHLEYKDFMSELIHNPVDFDQYKDKGKGKGILSLCQGENANIKLDRIAHQLGYDITFMSKYKNASYSLYDEIPKYELVISLGRGVYEAMACNKPVIVYDERGYTPPYIDGFISSEIDLMLYLTCNCSGRAVKREATDDNIIMEIIKYQESHSLPNYRAMAKHYFDVKEVVNKLLEA